MGTPAKDDPLGQRPDPADFGDMLNQIVDKRIEQAWRWRHDTKLVSVPDMVLVSELLARGWAVFKPSPNKEI